MTYKGWLITLTPEAFNVWKFYASKGDEFEGGLIEAKHEHDAFIQVKRIIDAM